MTISSPTFQRLQDGIKSVDDLRVRGPINAALKWLSGDLVTQLNTHFGAVSQSISAQISTLLASNNTWTGLNTFTRPGAGTVLTLRSSDSTATGGPDLVFDRESNSPAANDIIGAFNFSGRNSVGTTLTYANVSGVIVDKTDGSEDGRLRFVTLVAGAFASRFNIENGFYGVGVAGGDPGAGRANMNGYYVGGTQVVSSRVTGYGDPFGAISRATFSTTTVTTAALASFVAAMYTDLKAHGLIGN